ncbi:ABC transporter substrate-binding protein [Dechloromonas sp.]|uniref:ABC transporter substrate-binding protein n=1 Tax=Dechloromonas sp. TaxID=1917218 RepID=UPI00120B9C0D|nr:hypothetical protein [Dechloromonas sp.]TEX47621.1 MAG: hypothetical protein CFR70_08885 [Rhodocyclaceae bacterium]
MAWAGNVTLLLSDSAGPYAEFSSTFSEALNSRRWSIHLVPKADAYTPGAPTADLIVTAGSEALRQALQRAPPGTPILATLLPRQTFERLLNEAPRAKRQLTALVLDQPPARLSAFIRHLLPGQSRIGVLSSSETRHLLPTLRQSSAGLQFENEDADNDAALLTALNNLLPRVGVLLALPDASIYRRESIKSILITTYRQQRPVIAYSSAFVTAGALAAVYSTPAQIARQATQLIEQTGTLPAIVYPSQFAIAINANVAQALGLNVADEASLRQRLLGEGGQ